MRPKAAVVVLATTLLLGAGVGNAATSVETYPPVDDPQLPTVGGVFVRGEGFDNTVRVDYDRRFNEFLVRDSLQPLKLRVGPGQAEPCVLRGRRSARCLNPEPNERTAAITVRLRPGTDHLLPKSNLDTPIAANGGRGEDVVLGANGDDVLKGGPGPDVVRGREGDDNLTGGPGDLLWGDSGDDVVLADLGTVESAIECGPGDDRAFVDAADPATVGCEQVTVR